MLFADLFEISIFNEQKTNVVLEFQPSKGKQDRPRLDESLMRSLIIMFVFIIQSVHYGNNALSLKHLFEFKSNIQSNSFCVSIILGKFR